MFLHSPMMIVYLDGVPVKGLVDTVVDVTIVTENEALIFPHWKVRPSLAIRGIGAPG